MTLQKQVQKRAEYVTQNADLGIVDEDSARNNFSLNSLSRAPAARKSASGNRYLSTASSAVTGAAAPAQQRAPVGQSQLPANEPAAAGFPVWLVTTPT